MSDVPPMDAAMLAAMQQMVAAYMNKEKEKGKDKDNDKSKEKAKEKNDDDLNGWKSKKNKKSSKDQEHKKDKDKDRKRDRDRVKEAGKSTKISSLQFKERTATQTIIQPTQVPIQNTQSLTSAESQYLQAQEYPPFGQSTAQDQNGASSSNRGQPEHSLHSSSSNCNDIHYHSIAPHDTESSSATRDVKMETPVSSYRTAQRGSMYSESFPETIELFDGGIEEPRDRLTYRALQKELSRCVRENLQLKEQCGLQPGSIHQATAHHTALSAVADSRIFADIAFASHAQSSSRGPTFALQHLTFLSCIVSLVESGKLYLTRAEIGTICTYITDALSSHSFTQNDLDEVLTHIKTLIRHLMISDSSTLVGSRHNMLAELLLSVSTTPAMSPYVIIEAVDELVDFVTTLRSSLALAPSAAQATLVLLRHAEIITRSRHLMNAVESALVVPSSPNPDVAEQVIERFSALAAIPLDGHILQYAPLLCTSVWRLISVAAEMSSVTASRTLVEHIRSLEQARENFR